MTTTATPRKRKGQLAELEELEAIWAERAEATKALSQELHAKTTRLRELADRRQSIVHREPGTVDHAGIPLDPDGEVAAIDNEAGDLGAPGDLRARMEHAVLLEERARQDVMGHRQAHFAALVEDVRPSAEAARDEVHELCRATVAGVHRYLEAYHRSVGLTEPLPNVDGRNVDGVDQASALLTALEDPGLPVPVPDPDRRFA